MRFHRGVRVHLVGISGAGLSSLASYLKERGARVTGSDLRKGDVWNTLERMGIPLRLGHDPSHLDFREGWVVASAAVPRENPEIREARRRGMDVLKFSEALGELSRTRPTLAVAGTHGKTSTSGMLVCALRGGGQDPGYILGGSLVGEGCLGGRVGDGRNLVVEACEYDRSFHRLRPVACAILNVEADHFDCYPDRASLVESFQEFLGRVRPGGLAVLHEKAAFLEDFARRKGLRVLVVGQGEKAGLRARLLDKERGCCRFQVLEEGRLRAEVRLGVPGEHWMGNALAALALAREGGVSLEEGAAGLRNYKGMARRFEVHRGRGGLLVISDYAHHPTELETVLRAAREYAPGRRLAAFFQPHQYSRTRVLLDEFARVLCRFDRVFLADIYAARDSVEERAAVRAADLAGRIALRGGRVDLVGPARSAGPRILRSLDGGRDALLLLGAGDVDAALGDFLEEGAPEPFPGPYTGLRIHPPRSAGAT